MSTVAISDLPVATVINATDIIPFVQPAVAGTTKTITKTLLFTSPAIVTPTITNPTVSTGTFTSPALVTPAIGAATGTSLALTGLATVGTTLGVTGATTLSNTLAVTGVSTLTAGAVVQGMTVGLGTNSVASNTAVGTSALLGVTSGGFNTAVGFGALLSVAGGGGNVGVGYSAGGNINAGVSNTVLGNSALINCSGGSYNTSLGSSTGGTTGSNNTYVGYDSGSLSNSNSNNSYFGSFSGIYGAIDLRPNDSHIVLATGNGAPKQIIDSSGNAQFITGAVVVYTPAPASISAVATLTNANLQAQIINTTGTSYTVTMPLGSTLDTLIVWATIDIGFEFSVINTASGTITIAANTGVTTLGGLTIATGLSAKFRIRRTAASTYVMYRIS